MTTQTAWPVALDGSHSHPAGGPAARPDSSRSDAPVTSFPASRSASVDTSATVAAGQDRLPWRLSRVMLPLLVLTDVTLSGVLLGGQTWWVVAAAWGAGLVLLVRRLRPRLV